MKYSATVDDHRFEFELLKNDNGDGYSVRVQDREYPLEIAERAPGNVILRLNGKVYEILMKRHQSEGELLINGKSCQVHVEDLRLLQLRRLSGAGTDDSGPLQIKAPMPGLVLKILVQEGQKVARRDGLVIIEAMKMENEIRAERDGVVKRIEVKEGQAVDKNQLLLHLE